MFTVPVGIPCWGLGEHEPLIISLILIFVYRSNWRRPWTIIAIDSKSVTDRAVELECKR